LCLGGELHGLYSRHVFILDTCCSNVDCRVLFLLGLWPFLIDDLLSICLLLLDQRMLCLEVLFGDSYCLWGYTCIDVVWLNHLGPSVLRR